MSTSKHISACIKRLMKPRTGVHSIARRIAPGKKFRKETVAAVTKYVALPRLAHHATCFLGRCPKLLNLAPSGLLRQLLMNADNIRARAVVQIFDGRATRESSGEEACAIRAAVLHLPAPARVSQSLAVQFTISGMEDTAQDDGAAATDSTRAGRLSSDARGRRLFVMRAGARRFAVYRDEVEATGENRTKPTPLPFAPAPVRGLVSQRGRILTVIDPLLLLQPDARTTHAALVVALKGDEQLALAVESVEHELEISDDEADAAPDASNNLPLRRIIRHHAGDIALLDTARLFDAAMQGVERRRRRT